MNLPSNSSKKFHETQFEQFRTRLLARMCIALVCIVQLISRVSVLKGILDESNASGRIVLYALPCAPLVSLTVAIEYFLFKKKGPWVLKYSKIVDLIILFFFAADWISGLISSLVRTQGTDPVLFSVSAMYGFTAFAWRGLLVTLIVQTWHLKIIVPVIVTVVATAYAIHFDPEHYYAYIIRVIGHLFNIIFILYCEDKIKWRMILTNLQQEKWVQVNNFILNNIPENIMIMDVKGEMKFVSDHCRAFMHQCLASFDSKDFLNRIRDLERCDLNSQVSDAAGFITEIDIDRLCTGNGLLTQIKEGRRNSLKVETLADLILTFPSIVTENRLRERQFLIYNGKLKTENQSRSIEVKISFFQHYENEYIILILRDTTQRDLLVTLQETNKYKDQLLASVSHELRAPLNGNINLVEGAINSPMIPENVKETLLTPALRSSKFLLHMINDILDMSQINEKKLRLAFHSGDLKETLISAAQLVEFQAKRKGIDLVLELDPSIQGQFCTDHMRLSQILLNLLSNAIKFTNEGMIKLKAIQASQSVEISVEDTGIGMSEDNVKKLFSNYTHIEFAGRQTMNPTGVGLGLNIAYRLVQLLAPVAHQALNVESVLNYGSKFSFMIENKEKLPANFEEPEYLDDSNNPLKIAEETPGLIKPLLFSRLKTNSRTPELEIESPLKRCSCPQILIVDDNPFNIMAFETILGSLKIKCESVYSGPASIKKLLDCDNKKCGKKDCKLYSVIFMDQEMPEMTGAETVKEIRRLQKEKVVPQNMRIIGCTAHKAKEEVDRFLEAGLDLCIHKPISTTMIRELL